MIGDNTIDVAIHQRFFIFHLYLGKLPRRVRFAGNFQTVLLLGSFYTIDLKITHGINLYLPVIEQSKKLQNIFR